MEIFFKGKHNIGNVRTKIEEVNDKRGACKKFAQPVRILQKLRLELKDYSFYRIRPNIIETLQKTENDNRIL